MSMHIKTESGKPGVKSEKLDKNSIEILVVFFLMSVHSWILSLNLSV